jgi:hypothetical protein
MYSYLTESNTLQMSSLNNKSRYLFLCRLFCLVFDIEKIVMYVSFLDDHALVIVEKVFHDL